MAFHYTYPPESNGAQGLWVFKRRDQQFTTKLVYFTYSPTLRRVRRQSHSRAFRPALLNMPSPLMMSLDGMRGSFPGDCWALMSWIRTFGFPICGPR